MITINNQAKSVMARLGLSDFVKTREESSFCEQRKSVIECFSSLNEKDFAQTFQKFVGEQA